MVTSMSFFSAPKSSYNITLPLFLLRCAPPVELYASFALRYKPVLKCTWAVVSVASAGD